MNDPAGASGAFAELPTSRTSVGVVEFDGLGTSARTGAARPASTSSTSVVSGRDSARVMGHLLVVLRARRRPEPLARGRLPFCQPYTGVQAIVSDNAGCRTRR